jgi:hypothetical protein
VIPVAEYEVRHFCDGASFVWSPVNIEYWYRPGRFTGGEAVSPDVVSINKVSSGSGINQGVHGLDLRRVRSFNADLELQGLGLVLRRHYDELGWEAPFPMGAEMLSWFRVWYVFRGFNRFIYFGYIIYR